MPAFTKLRVLRLGAEPCGDPQFDGFVWLVSSLREVASAVGDGVSSLEEITVHLDCGPFDDRGAAYLLQTQNSVWEDLDTLLASSPKFSNLRKFEVYVCNPPPRNVLLHELGVENVEQLFCVWMFGLSEKGLLEVHSTGLYLEDIAVGEGEAR